MIFLHYLFHCDYFFISPFFLCAVFSSLIISHFHFHFHFWYFHFLSFSITFIFAIMLLLPFSLLITLLFHYRWVSFSLHYFFLSFLYCRAFRAFIDIVGHYWLMNIFFDAVSWWCRFASFRFHYAYLRWYCILCRRGWLFALRQRFYYHFLSADAISPIAPSRRWPFDGFSHCWCMFASADYYWLIIDVKPLICHDISMPYSSTFHWWLLISEMIISLFHFISIRFHWLMCLLSRLIFSIIFWYYVNISIDYFRCHYVPILLMCRDFSPDISSISFRYLFHYRFLHFFFFRWLTFRCWWCSLITRLIIDYFSSFADDSAISIFSFSSDYFSPFHYSSADAAAIFADDYDVDFSLRWLMLIISRIFSFISLRHFDYAAFFHW